jgi:hypothetical protein
VRELNIDWAALYSAFQMNMPEVRCFLSLEDGRVLKLPPGDPTLSHVRADVQRYVAIEAVPSRIQYQWIAEYIKLLGENPACERMEAAINGKGAFRRFKDILLTLPEERRRWFEFRDQKMKPFTEAWLNQQSLVAKNEAPWMGELGTEGGEDSVGNSSFLGSSGAEAAGPADDEGNLAPVGVVSLHRQPAAPVKAQHTVEAIRDFYIEWFDRRAQQDSPSPIELESLAEDFAKHFQVSSLR